MVRKTFGQIKTELSRVCGATGMSTADARIMDYVNAATQELMNEHDFASVIDRLIFSVTSGTITLPSAYDRIMMMTMNCVPMQMQSPWYEYVGLGLELLIDAPPQDNTYLNYLNQLNGVLDREDVCQFNAVPAGDVYLLRIYGQAGHDERDDDMQRAKIVVQGYDYYGKWIRTQNGSGEWIDGIEVEINGDTAPYFVDTTQSIKEITAIVKPETNGYVYAYGVPSLGGTPEFLAAYAPKDTNPFYRRYRIKGLNPDEDYQIVAKCRRRFIEITKDADQLIMTNLPALKAMIMAVFYLESNDPDNYLKYKATAVDILKKEMKAYVGLQTGTKPTMTFAEGMGVRRDGTLIL
jgi:hypothetical protein